MELLRESKVLLVLFTDLHVSLHYCSKHNCMYVKDGSGIASGGGSVLARAPPLSVGTSNDRAYSISKKVTGSMYS